MVQVIFSKIKLETPPCLAVIQFYSNTDEKHVSKSPQEFQSGQHSEIYLLPLKEQDKTKMELPLGMVSKHAFWYLYLPDYLC